MKKKSDFKLFKKRNEVIITYRDALNGNKITRRYDDKGRLIHFKNSDGYEQFYEYTD